MKKIIVYHTSNLDIFVQIHTVLLQRHKKDHPNTQSAVCQQNWNS